MKLDVRDLGGHLDTTYRERAVTLAKRVAATLVRILVVMAMPLDSAGKLRVLGTKFLLCALYGIEASWISLSASLKLSLVIPPAHAGAVLSLMDGLVGCDPGFYVVWCRFWKFLRYLQAQASPHREMPESRAPSPPPSSVLPIALSLHLLAIGHRQGLKPHIPFLKA